MRSRHWVADRPRPAAKFLIDPIRPKAITRIAPIRIAHRNMSTQLGRNDFLIRADVSAVVAMISFVAACSGGCALCQPRSLQESSGARSEPGPTFSSMLSISAGVFAAEGVDDLQLGGVGDRRVGVVDDLDLLRAAVAELVAGDLADQALEGARTDGVAQRLAIDGQRSVVVGDGRLVDRLEQHD